MQDTQTDRHLTQAELARRWDVSLGTLARWRTDGNGPKFLKLHGQVRYRLEDVQAFETDCLRTSTSERATHSTLRAVASLGLPLEVRQAIHRLLEHELAGGAA